jgi:hypothetical protein
VKGCGKSSLDADKIKPELGSRPESLAQDVTLLPLQHPGVGEESFERKPAESSSGTRDEGGSNQMDDDPFSSSQELTVSTIVKVLEQILDAAKTTSPGRLTEYVEAWTGFDLHNTKLLRELTGPSGFTLATERTKAITRYVHAVLVFAQWRDIVVSRNGPQELGPVETSKHTISSQTDSTRQSLSHRKELRLTTLPKSLNGLWGYEVIDRTIDAFLYRWSPVHFRRLQYRWSAACAVYYCKLRVDSKYACFNPPAKY